jgi:hypothetical protein
LSAPAGTVGFVGEGAAIPVRELLAGRLLLEPRKLAAICTLTREMVEAARSMVSEWSSRLCAKRRP